MDLIPYVVIVLLSLEQVVNVPFQRRRKLQPKFLPTPTNITVHRGELAVLKCRIKDLGPKVVVWRKQTSDVPFTIGEALFSQEENMAIEIQKLSEDETQYDLIIKDVTSSHSGTYLCQVTATKLYTHYVTLTVLDEPPVTTANGIVLTGSKFVNQDSQIQLRCNVSGILRAPDDVDWFFNGERILTSLPRWRDRTQILRRTMEKLYISELIVDRSTLDDDGTYVCRSSGSSEIQVDSIRVNVLSAEKEKPRRRGHMVLLAETVEDLQTNLDNCKMYCGRWGLKVNEQKTKVVVFRRRDPIPRNDCWSYNDNDPKDYVAGQVSSSSAAVTSQHSNIHLVILILCVITSILNCLTRHTIGDLSNSATGSNCDHSSYR